MPISRGAKPVNINNRKIINGADADVVQLYPMKHTFAWDAYTVGNANHWLPTEISMQRDIEQWRSKDTLTSDEPMTYAAYHVPAGSAQEFAAVEMLGVVLGDSDRKSVV